MSLGSRDCYQSWFLQGTVKLDRLVMIHTFGGRGSPIASGVIA